MNSKPTPTILLLLFLLLPCLLNVSIAVEEMTGSTVVNPFSSYGNNSNVIGSGFANYGESGNIANDSFMSYSSNGNVPENNFKSYGAGGNTGTKTFTSYRDQSNVGGDSFQSYTKNSNAAKVTKGTDKFTGYGQGTENTKVRFTTYGVNNTFKEYTDKKATSFSQYSIGSGTAMLDEVKEAAKKSLGLKVNVRVWHFRV